MRRAELGRHGVDAARALVEGDRPGAALGRYGRDDTVPIGCVLVHDGVGAWLITRRFSRGKVTFWPSADETTLHPLLAHELAVMLYNGDPRTARFAEPWRKLS